MPTAKFNNLSRVAALVAPDGIALAGFALAILITAGVTTFSPESAVAQDNPFGAANPFGATSAPDAPTAPGAAAPSGPDEPLSIDPKLPNAVRLLIKTTQQSEPSTTIEFARAAKTMTDIDQFDHARFYLRRLIALAPTDEQMFELEQVIGADFFLEIHAIDFLQPEGKQFARALFSSARRAATSPDRVNGLIRGLSNENITLRSDAFHSLKRIGASAAADMLAVFADPQREAEYPYLRGALRNMSDAAVAPLVGAAHSDNLQVQVEAVRALDSFPSGEAADAMLRVYLSPRLPESVRRLALDSMLNNYGFVRNPELAVERLYTRAREYLTGVRKLPGDYTTTVEMWRWNSATKKLDRLVVPKSTAEQMMAADRARDLMEIDPASPRIRHLFLLTALEAIKRQTGPAMKVTPEMFAPEMGQISAHEVAFVLREAIDLERIAAATGACELLQELGTIEQVMSSGGKPGILVEAMLIGDRHLQFAAFEAVAKIDPASSYSGSSYMTQLAVYLASTSGGGAVLVGHSRAGVAQSYATALGPSGVYPVTAISGRELLSVALQNPDFEAIFITDSISRPDYIELAQQLRSDWRTRRTPICLLIHSDESSRRVDQVLKRDPFLMALPASFESRAMGSHMTRLRRLAQPWGVTPETRRIHADAAMRWLARVANDRQRYGFYELGPHESTLIRTLYTPSYTDLSSSILAGLGTASAQRELVTYASQRGIPQQDRLAAAAAFDQSVRTSGVLLTTTEIQLQYDRYNASKREPVESQKVLGALLDSIESHRLKAHAEASPLLMDK